MSRAIQHFLNFFPLLHGHLSLLPIFDIVFTGTLCLNKSRINLNSYYVDKVKDSSASLIKMIYT